MTFGAGNGVLEVVWDSMDSIELDIEKRMELHERRACLQRMWDWPECRDACDPKSQEERKTYEVHLVLVPRCGGQRFMPAREPN
jgi:hypothetical protein